MCKFESSKYDESRAQSAGSLKAYRKVWSFQRFFWLSQITFPHNCQNHGILKPLRVEVESVIVTKHMFEQLNRTDLDLCCVKPTRHVSFADNPSVCGEVSISSFPADVSSPNFGSGDYPIAAFCRWTLQASDIMCSFTYSFTSFDTEAKFDAVYVSYLLCVAVYGIYSIVSRGLWNFFFIISCGLHFFLYLIKMSR